MKKKFKGVLPKQSHEYVALDCPTIRMEKNFEKSLAPGWGGGRSRKTKYGATQNSRRFEMGGGGGLKNKHDSYSRHLGKAKNGTAETSLPALRTMWGGTNHSPRRYLRMERVKDPHIYRRRGEKNSMQ